MEPETAAEAAFAAMEARAAGRPAVGALRELAGLAEARWLGSAQALPAGVQRGLRDAAGRLVRLLERAGGFGAALGALRAFEARCAAGQWAEGLVPSFDEVLLGGPDAVGGGHDYDAEDAAFNAAQDLSLFYPTWWASVTWVRRPRLASETAASVHAARLEDVRLLQGLSFLLAVAQGEPSVGLMERVAHGENEEDPAAVVSELLAEEAGAAGAGVAEWGWEDAMRAAARAARAGGGGRAAMERAAEAEQVDESDIEDAEAVVRLADGSLAAAHEASAEARTGAEARVRASLDVWEVQMVLQGAAAAAAALAEVIEVPSDAESIVEVED